MNFPVSYPRYRPAVRSGVCTILWPEDVASPVFARASFGHQLPPWFPPEMLGAMRLPLEPAPVPVRVEREILRDSRGRLYERVGDLLHPLEPAALRQAEIIDADEDPEPRKERTAETGAPRRLLEPLLGGRVVKRLLRFVDWKHLLARQLRHPERLADNHKLPCDLRLFELTAPATDSQIDKHGPRDLQPLDEASAGKLGLTRELPPPGPEAAAAGETHRRGARFFTIIVAHDPTAKSPASSPPAAAPKNRIPEAYMRPWEFLHTREQAAAALCAPAPGGWRARLIRFLERKERHEALERWRSQMAGKPFDDQLWGSRPPAAALRDPGVRDWASRTLTAAGYDAGAMLNEWEIYWTRKGV
jgi:hypothetical protein